MKLKTLLFCGFLVALVACSNNKDKDKTDPTDMKVPTNSDATNPSLADTSFKNADSPQVKKDTVKR